MMKPNLPGIAHGLRCMVTFFFALIVVSGFRVVLAQTPQPNLPIRSSSADAVTQQSHAVIESATYQATFQDGDFTNGDLRWKIIHRGPGDATIDFSDTNLALNDLSAESQPLVWGTTTRNRRLMIIGKDSGIVSGEWSKHGDEFPGMSMLNCQFPPALETQVSLRVPNHFRVQSSVGHVEVKADEGDANFKIWMIDLGRHRTTTFSVLLNKVRREVPHPKVEIDAIHVARRDGIFFQGDFSIEGIELGHRSEIKFGIPASLTIQSITSSGVPIEYVRKSTKSRTVTVNLPKGIPRGRINLRIQGFQPSRWILKQTLPFLWIPGAIEAKRTTSLRVESPLELHRIEPQGFFQVSLSKEPRGEVWRFESFRENPQLIVDLGTPNTAVSAEIHSLHYLDTPLPWSVSKISVTAKSGRLFHLKIVIPKNSTVVSVIPVNSKSEIASWSVDQQSLSVTFKEPISFDSGKTIEILTRLQRLSDKTEQRLPVPVVEAAATTSIQSHWVLPAALDMDLDSGTSWNELTSPIKFDQFKKTIKPEDKNRVQTHRSFFNSNANTRLLPKVRIFPISETASDPLENSDPVELSSEADGLTSDVSTSAPSVRVFLLTQAESLGSVNDPKLVHHATIQVHGECATERLDLQLPGECLLSAVSVDGKAVTVFHDGDFIRFPEEIASFREVTLIYISRAEKKWLGQSCRIPLPKFSLNVSQFDWKIEIPADRALTQVLLPNSKLETNHQRLFLGSFSMQPHFWGRNSSSNSNSVLGEEALNAISTDNRGSVQYQFHSLSIASEVQFETWDVRRASNFAWAAFLGSMIVGAGGRLFRRQWIRKTIPYWLFLLVAVQFFAVNQWSMVVGAMLTGTFISLLVPFELLQLSKIESSPVRLPNLSTATAIFLVLGGCAIFAQDRSNSTATTTATGEPAEAIPYLLQSVRYELLESSPNKLFRATIEVFTPSQTPESLVELSYKGVVFQSGAKCLIDGREQTVIPVLNGGGVVVRISNDPEEVTNSLSPDWNKHIVQFDFSLRMDESREAGHLSRSEIPGILDATLKLPGKWDEKAVVRHGQILSSHQNSTLVSLGAVNTISHSENKFENHDDFHFFTLLNVSSARITGQLYIKHKDSPIKSESKRIDLQLPPTVLVTNVNGSSAAKWFQTTDKSTSRKLVIESRANVPNATIVVSFCLPTMINTIGEVVVPKLNWSDHNPRQIIGLKGPTGISLELVKDLQGLRNLTAESWPQDGVFGRNRPSQILELMTANELRIVLNELRPTSRYSVTEVLTVRHSTLSWSADLEIEIEGLPIFVHEMELRGGVRINSVGVRLTSAGLADAREETPLRFHQVGNRLSVFIPGGHLGARNIHFTGEVPFLPEIQHALPEITAVGSKLSQRSLTIKDKTNWDIELEMPGGTTVSKPSLAPEEFHEVRNIGAFQSPNRMRPTKIRLRPPQSATRVDIATRLQVTVQDKWNVVQLLHFSSKKTPIKKVKFSIPRGFGNFNIRPRGLRIDRVENKNDIDVTIHISKRQVDDLTIQIFSQLPSQFKTKVLESSSKNAVAAIPEVQVHSAQTASRFFFLNENRLVAARSSVSVPVESKDIPPWIPPVWKSATDNSGLMAFQLLEQNAQLVPMIVNSSHEQPALNFVETTLWPQPNHVLTGITRLWLTQLNALKYVLPFQESVTLTHAFLPDGRELVIEKVQNQRTIDIEAVEQVMPITIHWKSQIATSGELFSPLTKSKNQPKHLIGIAEYGAFSTTIPTDRRLSPIDIWIYRWQSLLDMAEKLNAPLAVESALHQDLRECQSVIQGLASTTALNKSRTIAIDQLKEKWSTVLEEITIEAPAVTTDLKDTTSSFGLLQDVENQFQEIQWMTTESVELSTIRIVESRNWPQWLVLSSSLLTIIFALAVLLSFRKPLIRWANYSEQEPALGLLILGVLWFLFLQPAMFSLMICAVAAGLYWLKLTRTSTNKPAL